MKKFLVQVFTEPNNHTFCPVRVLAASGGVQYLALATWHAFKSGGFDCQGFALGFAALLGGMGAALGMKKDSPQEVK